MAQAALRLVEPKFERDHFLFERRGSVRRPITGQVTAVRNPGISTDVRPKICSLRLLDISDTGLGVLSAEPAELGADMTVLFPPHGPDGVFDSRGRVVRCIQHDFGYEIGIHFDGRSAA